MIMKNLIGLVVCVLLASFVPSALADVTVDLSSPQEVITLAPGDTIDLALTIANDSEEELDLVVARMDVQVNEKVPGDGIPDPAPGNLPGISHKPIRVKLAPGDSQTINLELVLPDYKNLPAGDYDITISVVAKGLVSGTEASDAVSLLMVKP